MRLTSTNAKRGGISKLLVVSVTSYLARSDGNIITSRYALFCREVVEINDHNPVEKEYRVSKRRNQRTRRST